MHSCRNTYIHALKLVIKKHKKRGLLYRHFHIFFLADSSKCEFLDAPTNGFVVIGGFQHGDNATYFCNTDYFLMNGDHVRQCMTNGQWSGNAPSCQSMLLYSKYKQGAEIRA